MFAASESLLQGFWRTVPAQSLRSTHGALKSYTLSSRAGRAALRQRAGDLEPDAEEDEDMAVEVAFYRALGELHAGGEIGGQGRPDTSDIVVLDVDAK